MPKTIRDTKQRSAILRSLHDYGHPMTAKQILDAAGERVPTLGIATVYRTLRNMLATGEIEQIDMPGATSYYTLPQKGNCLLMVCKESQRVESVSGVELPSSMMKRLPSDFRAVSFQVFVLGHFVD